MRIIIWSVLAVFIFVSTGCANLTWVEPKTYAPPPSGTVMVDGFGINGPVTILQPGPGPITVSHPITNSGTVAASAGYSITDTVIQWIFQGNPVTGYGWVPGPPATHTVTTAPAAGPLLAPGATAVVTFPPFLVPNTCGLFSETLAIDTANAVVETSEADNVDPAPHLFFIPSTQQFNIAVTTINDSLFHADGDVATHTFTITPAGAPGWIYAGFSFTTNEGSTAYTDPPPSLPSGPLPQIITMHVVTKKHSNPQLGPGQITGKISVVSNDGCVFKQQSATVLVEHQ